MLILFTILTFACGMLCNAAHYEMRFRSGLRFQRGREGWEARPFWVRSAEQRVVKQSRRFDRQARLAGHIVRAEREATGSFTYSSGPVVCANMMRPGKNGATHAAR